MKARLLIALFIAGSFGVAGAEDDAKKEAKKFAGTWVGTSSVDRGQEVPEEQIKKLQLVFTGDKFEVSDGDTNVMKGNFVVDPSKKPKAIDLKSTEGRHQGETTEGIYEWDGDNLKICLMMPGKGRPEKVPSTEENRAFLLVCRKKP